MTRQAKIAAWAGVTLLGLLAVIVDVLLLLGNTDSGRALIATKVAQLTHGEVRLAGIHGSFPAALELDRLELRDNRGLWLWANHLSLRWSPGALLARHVDVDSFHIELLHVERLPAPKARSTSHTSSVPHADVRALTVDTLELGRALVGDPASLGVKASAHIRSLKDADIHLDVRRTGGDGNYEVHAHADPQSINAIVQLREPAHGPLAHLINVPDAGALLVHAKLTGPRNAEDLHLAVDAGPLHGQANGRINLRDSAADLTYSLLAPKMSPNDGLGWNRIELQGQLHGAFTKLTADGHLLIEALRVPGGVRVAQVDARVKGDQGFISLQAGIDGLEVPGRVPKLFADSRLTIDASAHLDDPQRPLRVTAHHQLFTLAATAVTAGHRSADVDLRLPDLKPFASWGGSGIKGDAQVGLHLDYAQALMRLTANVSSHLDGGDAGWSGLVRGGLTQLQLTVEVTDRQIALKKLQLTARAVSATAEGDLSRTGDQSVSARFGLTLPDLRRASAALGGDMKVTGTVDGPRNALSADTRLTANLSVRSSPREAVSARFRASGLPNAPQGSLSATGQLDGAPLQVNVQIKPAKNDQYRAIIQEAHWKSAHAKGDVTFGGAVTDARGTARISLTQLSDFSNLAGRPLSGSVTGQIALVARGGQPSAQLDLEARGVGAGGDTANARLHGDGPMNALHVTLAADSPALAGSPARLNAATVVDLSSKQLQLASLNASYHNENLHLLNPATVGFAQGLVLQHLKLGAAQATVEVDGRISPTLDVHAAVKHLDAALVNAFVPDLLGSGTADADAVLHGTTSAPTGSVHLQAQNVRVKSVQAQGLPAMQLRMDARLNGSAADVDAHLTTGSSELALTGTAPLAVGGSANLKLIGNLDLALADPLLEAGGRDVTGMMAINTTFTGSTAAPQIAGTVRLSNGSFKDYTEGINLTDVSAQLSGTQGVLRIDRFTARAAPGSISLQGTVGVLQPKIPIDIKLTAQNAQPISSNIITANLNADLQVKGALRDQLDLSGKVHLNHANITIPGGLPPEVAVLDVERDGVAQPVASAPPLVINLHLDVDALNRILVNGRGLDAELGGQLQIRGTTAAPRVDGGFELQRGFFTLANSKLTFSSGSVTFNGNGVRRGLDPSLDFTAQTQAAGVTAIVHITGLVDAPHIELTSTPELPSDEILSRLLFGEPAAELTGLQVVEMGVALASLRGGGNGPSLNPLTRIQKALGLDRLSVGSAANTSDSSSSTQQPSGYSVAAGRYISSRVYVGVQEGTTGSSQVDVDVDLTKNLKLQAQLGNGTATAQGVTPANDPGNRLGLAYQFEY